MKKVRGILVAVVALVMAFSFVGCDNKAPVKQVPTNKVLAKVSDVYAFSVASAAELMTAMPQSAARSARNGAYLAANTATDTATDKAADTAADTATDKPADTATDKALENDELAKRIEDVNNYLVMFEGMLAENPINTTVKENVTYKEVVYTSYMQISEKKLDGTTNTFDFYFNETKLVETPEEENKEETPEEENKEQKEVNNVKNAAAAEDDDIDSAEREQEIETKLTGIMLAGDVEYTVTGKKEIETEEEGGEVEKEFKITFTATDANKNTIKITQTVEEEEGEKEQKFSYEMRDAKNAIISKSVISMEVEQDETQIELNIEEGGVKTAYRFDREEDEIKIKYTNADGSKVVCKVTITTDANGKSVYKYKFPGGETKQCDRD